MPSKSFLRGMAQVSYVTNDMDAAIEVLSERFAVVNWMQTGKVTYQLDSEELMTLKVAMAYVGAVQFEIIEPIAGAVELYLRGLPRDQALSLEFHHLGFEAGSREEVEALQQEMRTAGHHITFSADYGGAKFFYVDARGTVGHYLEYFYLEERLRAGIPRN